MVRSPPATRRRAAAEAASGRDEAEVVARAAGDRGASIDPDDPARVARRGHERRLPPVRPQLPPPQPPARMPQPVTPPAATLRLGRVACAVRGLPIHPPAGRSTWGVVQGAAIGLRAR